MKKIRNLILVASILLVATLTATNSNTLTKGDISLDDIITMAMADDEGGSNTATCYSTVVRGLYNPITVFICGECIREKVKSHSDPGTCYF